MWYYKLWSLKNQANKLYFVCFWFMAKCFKKQQRNEINNHFQKRDKNDSTQNFERKF